MDNKRISLEEFKALFPGRCEAEDQWLREYRSFQGVFEHLEAMTVPDLSRMQKAEIFQRSWQAGRRRRLRVWPTLFRQPVVTFAAGIVLGCTLMFTVLHAQPRSSQPPLSDQHASTGQPTAAGQMLTIEQTRYTQVYKGKIVERLYPQVENPRIVVEKTEESSPAQRVLYGTLDDGEVYVVWNL